MASQQTTQHRNTRQRRLVLDAVCARCDHPTAEDIYNDVHAVDERVSRGTVYRNLNLLDESGQIMVVRTNGAMRFDGRTDAHNHLVCRVCGSVVDAPLPYDTRMDRNVAEKTGYAIEAHTTVFEGVCPACQQAAAESARADGDGPDAAAQMVDEATR